jgi:DnaJ-class molecular chaperone
MNKTPQEWRKVKCAACNGSGRDRWNLTAPLSTCSACGGRGYQQIEAPYRRCEQCSGAGVHPHMRVTCTACGGVGWIVTEPENAHEEAS